MNRFLITSGLTAAVLVSGLIGCGKETKTTKDVFSPPQPKIVRGDYKTEYSQWNAQSSRDMDFQDELDVSETGAQSADIVTSCLNGSTFSTQTISVPSPTKIKIYRLMPEAVLIESIDANKVVCSFKIKLTNATGSLYVFSVDSASMIDYLNADVRLGIGSESYARSPGSRVIAHGDLNSATFWTESHELSTAELICKNATFSQVPFLNSGKLVQFNFDSVRPRDNASLFLLSNSPQPCRIVVKKDGQVKGMSALFNVEIKIRGIEAIVGAPIYTDLDSINQDTGSNWGAFLQPAIRFRFSELILTNHSENVRKVLLPKRKLRAKTYAFMDGQAYVREGEFIQIFPRTSEGVTLKDESPEFWTLEFQGGKSIILDLDITNPGTPFCLIVDGGHLPNFSGLGAEAVERGSMKELSTDGVEIRDISFDLGHRFALPRVFDNKLVGLPGNLLLGLPQTGCGL